MDVGSAQSARVSAVRDGHAEIAEEKKSSQAHPAVPLYTREDDLNAVGPIEDAVRGLKCERHANVGVTGGELIREREGVINPEKRMCDDVHHYEKRCNLNGNTRRLRTGWGDESGKMNWEEGF